MLRRPVQSVAPSVIEALRDATRSRHAQLSASPAMSRLYTIPEYRSHLGRLAARTVVRTLGAGPDHSASQHQRLYLA